jgi:hypothetical protein
MITILKLLTQFQEFYYFKFLKVPRILRYPKSKVYQFYLI